MKLKKIASLALAGIMAVSMLAGCSGKTGSTEDNGSVVEANNTSAVTAFNNNQDEDNDVKVVFSADSKLDDLVAQAVRVLGKDAKWDDKSQDDIQEMIAKLTGKTSDNLFAEDTDNDDLADGMTATKWYGMDLNSEIYWSETDAVNAAARAADAEIAKLPVNTKEGKKDGAKYYEYSYTGNVSVVAFQNLKGNTVYHVVYTITQTANEKTVKAE